jgi:UDP-3-O-[3-hydroxymyristoyl] glucosamine N-acyltransferase
VPAGIGLAVCDNPRACFVDIHNHLTETPGFFWRDFPTFVDPSARVHPSAQLAAFNVVVGAGSIIEANAIVGERVIIGERCVIQSCVIIGAEGFQTDRSGNRFQEMIHAGGVRLEADAKVFAGAILARGVFREFTVIGPHARIGNQAFVSHNVHVGCRSFVGHGAIVNGNVKIGDGAWIGPGAVIANNLGVGLNAHLGLGSVLIRDAEANARLIGAVAVRSERMLRFAAELDKR